MRRAPTLDPQFAHEVRAGLTQPGQKTLDSRYLDDCLGCALREAIALVPEYGLRRAATRIVEAHAGHLLDCLSAPVIVAGLADASRAQAHHILRAVRKRQSPVYCAIHGRREGVPDALRRLAAARPSGTRVLVLFAGGGIGRFEPGEAIGFLQSIRRELALGDAVLLGTDLMKPTAQLLDAYDDPTGVTAAFNLNRLGAINRALDGDFDLRQFAHVVRYHQEAQRIEMHLRSRVYQIVSIPKADLIVDFAAGETICTETCYLFHPEQVETMATAAGFQLREQCVDEEWGFAESLLMCAE